MSTLHNPKTLYVKYFEEFGQIPDKPEYFIAFCKKYNVTLRYKDCRHLFQNPPIRADRNLQQVIHLTDHSGDEEDEEEELKYHTDDHAHSINDNNHSPANISHTHSSSSIPKHIQHNHQHKNSQSPSPATPSPISFGKKVRSASSNSSSHSKDSKQSNFQLLHNGQKITESAIDLDLDYDSPSNYLSPEILVDRMIPLNDNMSIISYHRDLNELTISKCPLYRDGIFFCLYWIGLINGIIDIHDFSIWYFRFLSLLLWLVIIALSLLCHHYGKSPPFYPIYYGSDCQYTPRFDKTAIDFIKEWNVRGKYDGNDQDDELNERSLGVKLFYIEMYGGLSDSKCGYVKVNVKKVVDKSVDILQDILNYGRNKLIRLRIYHVLRFRNYESHNKFTEILKKKKQESIMKQRAEQMWHIEYNTEVEDRLLMNTTHLMEGNPEWNLWNGWNECCSNKRMSYIWYIIGFGFCFRAYHDCCIKTKIYDCVKEVTL